MNNLKKSVMMVLAIAVMVSCFSFPAMAATSTPEVVVTSTESSQSVLREIRDETPFLGDIYKGAVSCIKAEVFTSDYTYYKYCKLGGLDYWNDSQYSVTVEFAYYDMRSAWGECYASYGSTQARSATLRVFL